MAWVHPRSPIAAVLRSGASRSARMCAALGREGAMCVGPFASAAVVGVKASRSARTCVALSPEKAGAAGPIRAHRSPRCHVRGRRAPRQCVWCRGVSRPCVARFSMPIADRWAPRSKALSSAGMCVVSRLEEAPRCARPAPAGARALGWGLARWELGVWGLRPGPSAIAEPRCGRFEGIGLCGNVCGVKV